MRQLRSAPVKQEPPQTNTTILLFALLAKKVCSQKRHGGIKITQYQPFPDHLVTVKIVGKNQETVKELMKCIEQSGFDIVRNSKHKPRLHLDQKTGDWLVYIHIHSEPEIEQDGSLFTIPEGIEESQTRGVIQTVTQKPSNANDETRQKP